MKSGRVDLKRSPGTIGGEAAAEQGNWESFVIVLGAALSDVSSAHDPGEERNCEAKV